MVRVRVKMLGLGLALALGRLSISYLRKKFLVVVVDSYGVAVW